MKLVIVCLEAEIDLRIRFRWFFSQRQEPVTYQFAQRQNLSSIAILKQALSKLASLLGVVLELFQAVDPLHDTQLLLGVQFAKVVQRLLHGFLQQGFVTLKQDQTTSSANIKLYLTADSTT